MVQPMHTFDWFLLIVQVVDTVKNGLNSNLLVGIGMVSRMICLSLSGVQRTKDDSSLSIVRRSWVIGGIGLNFVGSEGVGKNARRVSSYSRVTILFVAGVLGGLWGVVLACC